MRECVRERVSEREIERGRTGEIESEIESKSENASGRVRGQESERVRMCVRERKRVGGPVEVVAGEERARARDRRGGHM